MPADFPKSPTITRLQPLWRPLGVEDTRWGFRYWLEINGRVRRLKPSQMCGCDFLSDVYPDMEHWRRLFPWGYGRRIDTKAALTYFLKACREAGAYVPASDLRPPSKRPVGRPRRSPPDGHKSP